jgi:hypothetical protein
MMAAAAHARSPLFKHVVAVMARRNAGDAHAYSSIWRGQSPRTERLPTGVGQSVRMAPTAARVNLFSDTQTLPTPAMRRAIADADVGDEQMMADPTVNDLCERVADLLGFEAAVFLPSGTMCNEIAIRVHVRAGGDALFLHRTAHVLRYEAGAPAALSGAVLVALDGPRGMFHASTLEAAIADHSVRRARPTTRSPGVGR